MDLTRALHSSLPVVYLALGVLLFVGSKIVGALNSTSTTPRTRIADTGIHVRLQNDPKLIYINLHTARRRPLMARSA